MNKINSIKINGVTRNIENIAYLTSLPTASADSVDIVSVNGVIYTKYYKDGAYSYVALPTPLTAGNNITITDGVISADIDVSSLATQTYVDTAIANNTSGAVSTIKTSNLTTNRVLVSNASGKVAASGSITTTELGYLDGVTSNIQTQINTINTNVAARPTQTEVESLIEDFVTFEENPSTYTVEALSGVTYGFTLGSDGYYASTNKSNSTFSLCKVTFNLMVAQNIVISCYQSSESNYDYGLLSTLDKTLNADANVDSANVFASHKSLSGNATTTYSNVSAGEHFIYIKYRKNSSSSNGSDVFKFKIEPLIAAVNTNIITDGTNTLDLSEVGHGVEIIDITDLDAIPEDYQDVEKLKTCYLKDNELIFHISFIEGTDLYYGCFDDLIYTSIGVDDSFEITRREDYQSISVATQDDVNTLQTTINTLTKAVSTKQDQLTAGRNIVIEEDGTIGIANPNNCKVVAELPELTPELADEETIYSYEGKLYNIIYDTATVEHEDLCLAHSYSALPYPLNGMSATAVNENIYIIGGYSPTNSYNNRPIYKFNTSSKAGEMMLEWQYSSIEDHPAVTINDTIYWVDRAPSYGDTKICSINPATNVSNAWIFNNYLNINGSHTATVVGTDIYFITIDGELYKFDTTNKTLSFDYQLENGEDMGGCALIAYGTNLYIFGGYSINTIIKYDTLTQTETTLDQTLLLEQCLDMAPVIWKDKILLIGGHNNSGIYYNTFYCFDPINETVTLLDTQLPQGGCKDLEAVVVNDAIYIIGGDYAGTSSNLILEYSNFTTEPTNMRYQQLTYGDASFNPYFEDTGLVLDELADEEMSGGMWVYTPVRGE